MPVTEMVGVREYAEEMAVELARDRDSGRLIVFARNEGGFNNTRVDLLDILDWIAAHPDWPNMEIRTL